MALTDIEQQFLTSHRHGRLATVAPGGIPQVKPVGFTYNSERGTIDISGYNMGGSAKYRNVRSNSNVAFVVDDTLGEGEGAAGMRFLEIRGRAEALSGQVPSGAGLAAEIIRIHPRRVLGFNLDPEHPGLQARDIDRGRPKVA